MAGRRRGVSGGDHTDDRCWLIGQWQSATLYFPVHNWVIWLLLCSGCLSLNDYYSYWLLLLLVLVFLLYLAVANRWSTYGGTFWQTSNGHLLKYSMLNEKEFNVQIKFNIDLLVCWNMDWSELSCGGGGGDSDGSGDAGMLMAPWPADITAKSCCCDGGDAQRCCLFNLFTETLQTGLSHTAVCLSFSFSLSLCDWTAPTALRLKMSRRVMFWQSPKEEVAAASQLQVVVLCTQCSQRQPQLETYK